MKRLTKRVGLWMLLALGGLSSLGVLLRGGEQDAVTPALTYALSDEQVSRYLERANKGDTRSAQMLRDYYGFFRADTVQMKYWERRLAEMGDARNQYFLASASWHDAHYNPQYDSQTRASLRKEAELWARKAADQGDADAIRLLRDIEKAAEGEGNKP